MKLIHFTDTHFVSPGEMLYGLDPRARLDACIADINAHHADADLAVLTGDLTHFGDVAAFENVREALSALRVPLRLLVGNHDRNETFRRTFPEVPVDPHGNIQSVMDTEAGRLMFLDTTRAGSHGGWYDAARLDWLEAQLRDSGASGTSSSAMCTGLCPGRGRAYRSARCARPTTRSGSISTPPAAHPSVTSRRPMRSC